MYFSTVKHLFILIVVVICLLGLVFIQYRLLKTGLLLEKERFDQRVEVLLGEVVDDFNQPSVFQQQLLQWRAKGGVDSLHLLEQMLPIAVENKIGALIAQQLEQQDISTEFSFALQEDVANRVIVQSADYLEEGFAYQQYRKPVIGPLAKACDCHLYLIVRFNNLFNYLIGQLMYLIIPSIIFLVVLLVCIWILIRNLWRQYKRDQIKNDFINNLTHELKTPVFSVRLLTKLLKESIQGGEQEKSNHLIKLVRQENSKMETHIEKVLELATLEQQKYQIRQEVFDFHQMLDEVSDSFEVALQERKGFFTKMLKAENTTLCGDRTHLKNVCSNLIDNAMKYSAGVPHIQLQTSNIKGQFLFTITDNGIGIPQAYQAAIFEKFYRIPTGDLHPVKGFGLGLSYVRQVVEAHRGQIEVKSKPGEGSCFEIRLPINKG